MSCDVYEEADACVMLFDCSIYTGLKQFELSSPNQMFIWDKLSYS